jgi:hypothetical protein
MIEHALHDRLTIIEGAFDGDRIDVSGLRRRHQAPLHVGDAAFREQDDQIDLAALAERLDSGAAGIPRSRRHDRAPFAARGQHVVHQPRQKLHRQVLEGERRPVKQLERERVHAELHERRDRGMTKIAVSLARHAGEVGLADRIVGKTPDHLPGHFRIGAAGERHDRLRLDPRPGLRHVEAAVAGETRKHGLGEAERRGLAPGGDVTHCAFLRTGAATGDIF